MGPVWQLLSSRTYIINRFCSHFFKDFLFLACSCLPKQPCQLGKKIHLPWGANEWPSFGWGHSSLLIPWAIWLILVWNHLGTPPYSTDVSSGQRALEREIQQLGSLQVLPRHSTILVSYNFPTTIIIGNLWNTESDTTCLFPMASKLARGEYFAI